MSIDSTVSRPMRKAREAHSENRFVPGVLPWLIAGVALLLYTLSLNHWLSLSSLLPVARLSGWIWQPSLTDPLYWLVTYPLRWLPASLIPILLNLFSAVCAALTLALLARSVSLLPHDRTKEQRIRLTSPDPVLSISTSWVPPVVAALVCGLQLSFWENATAASIEMFNLLIFAYVIRCLLEYRIDERDSWLVRASLVYGAGMANNWAMIGFFPAFLVAIVWIKGKGIFNGGFLGRMFVAGVAGLSLYLLLPTLVAFTNKVDLGFWQALKTNLAQQKTYLTTLVFNKDALLNGDHPLWVLGLPSLLPLLAVSVRLPSFMGDISKLGVALTNLGFHLVNGVLLVVCLWVALDPGFSPRHYQPLLGNYGIYLLTFYYLGALSIGYFVGYFLLVFGVTPSGRQRYRKTYPAFINQAVVVLVCVLVLATPILSLCRNLPQIRRTNGPQLKRFADLVTEKLPAGGGLLLSDDARRLLLIQSALTQGHRNQDYVLLDTASLEYPDYHRFLSKVYPTRWQYTPPKSVKQLPSSELQTLVYNLTQSNSVFYLHPSFGYYFELLYPVPHGIVYQLSPYPKNEVIAPTSPAEVVSENEVFWAKADDLALRPIAAAVTAGRSAERLTALDRLGQTAHLAFETNRDASILGSYYSEGLNYWGVQVQRQNKLAEAASHFNRALEVNPDNVVAEVNLDCNRKLQSGQSTTVQLTKDLEDKFGHRSWDQIMRENGPFDEPTFCYAQGNALWQGGNDHQAALQFERVRVLQPDNVPARLALAQIYLFHRLPDATLQVINEMHAKADPSALNNHTNAVQLLGLETSAYLAKGEPQGAEKTVEAALAAAPNDPELLAAASKIYLDFGYYTNALRTINRQLQVRPDDPGALFYKGTRLPAVELVR
jgi:tetratricopeptide (TPR) repeat protein